MMLLMPSDASCRRHACGAMRAASLVRPGVRANGRRPCGRILVAGS